MAGRGVAPNRRRMLMERKARIIRFWFATLGVALLGVWEPALWFGIVPLFFFPGCSCCPTCTCENCLDDLVTCNLEVELVDITNGACSTCTDLNALYVLTPNAGRIPSYPEDCRWVYQLPSGICTIVYISARLVGVADITRTMIIGLHTDNDPLTEPWNFQFQWNIDPEPEPSCTEWEDVATTGQAGIGSFGCIRSAPAYAVFSAA